MPLQISGMFDSLTYGKGGVIVRMVRDLMGEGPFWDAIREFLKNKEFGNVNQEDLFAILDKHARRNNVGKPESCHIPMYYNTFACCDPAYDRFRFPGEASRRY